MYYERIVGYFDFEDLYRFAVADAPQQARFVEVGCMLGRSACFLAETIRASGKQISLDAVDPFPDDWYGLFTGHMRKARVARIVTARQMVSLEAAQRYEPQSLDFVFLDADHSQTAVTQDIDAWYPLLKTGGILAGHDYTVELPGVMRAVDARFGPGKAIPPRSWAIRKTKNISPPGRLAGEPVSMPVLPPQPQAFAAWQREAVSAVADEHSPIAFYGSRFGEQAVETLLFLTTSGQPPVRHRAYGALATLLTPPNRLSETGRAIIQVAFEVAQNDSDEAVRRTSGNALEFLRAVVCQEASAQLQALQSPEEMVRAEALRALQSLPRAAIEEAYRPIPEARLWDCLDLAFVEPPQLPARPVCIATIASPGDAASLDQFLGDLTRLNDCSDSTVVVFTVAGDAVCSETARRHGAIAISCQLRHPRTSLQGLLYSVARIVEADKYLCVSHELQVTGSLHHFFEALEALYSGSVFVLPGESVPYSGEKIEENEMGVEFLIGRDALVGPLVLTGSSMIAGRRRGMLGLDQELREMQPFARAWIDGSPAGDQRQTVVISCALAKLGSAVALHKAPVQSRAIAN